MTSYLLTTRSTQRVQTSLAEADHYSNMPTVKMLSLGGERLTPPPPPPHTQKKKKFWIITCTTIWLCYRYYGIFCSFTHLRILRPGSLGLLCSTMYESNTALCTYWIPEIVEPTSSNKLKKGLQEIQVCSSLTIYALMNAESRYYPQSSLYEDSIYFFSIYWLVLQ